MRPYALCDCDFVVPGHVLVSGHGERAVGVPFRDWRPGRDGRQGSSGALAGADATPTAVAPTHQARAVVVCAAGSPVHW